MRLSCDARFTSVKDLNLPKSNPTYQSAQERIMLA